MPTYVMSGSYSLEGMRGISPARTDETTALIRKHGGELRAVYALLGKPDLLVIVDLPDNARAMQTSMSLSRLLGVAFTTSPALTVQEFDRLVV